MESAFVLLVCDPTFLSVNNLNFPVLIQAKKLSCLLGLQVANFKFKVDQNTFSPGPAINLSFSVAAATTVSGAEGVPFACQLCEKPL